MRRISFLATFLAIGLALNLPFASAEEKFHVQNSPFGRSFFMIQSNASSWSNIESKARQDANDNYRDYTYKNEPPGQLIVCFEKVVKDLETTKTSGGPDWFCVAENALDINVDKNAKGMTISYVKRNGRSPERVLLIVPSNASKEAWRARASKAYMTYFSAFYAEKARLIGLNILNFESEAAEHFQLNREEPKIIYPD